MKRQGTIVVWLLSVACGTTGAGGAISTAIDSTGDSVIVTIRGDVPAADVRHLVPEVVIAPGIDDTTLFTSVWEFDVDDAGRFWVYDNGSNSIFQFAPDGALIRRIGREGAGPGEFRQDGGMVTLPGDGLAVWDSRNSRITELDSTGRFMASRPLPGGFSSNDGLYSDRSGALYLRRPVTEPREGEILGRMGLVPVGPNGEFTDSLAPPDLPVPRQVYLAEQEGNRSSTSSRYAPNYYWGWLPSGEFVAAHGGEYRMVIARRTGRSIVVQRVTGAVPVDPEERSIEEQSITYNMRQTEPGWSWRGPPLPTEKAPMVGLATDRDGRIWAQVAMPSERIPEAELPVQRDSLQPVIRHRMPVAYEVFTASGEFLGRVEFPARARFIDASGDNVWILGRDENDVPAVGRYRLVPGLGADMGAAGALPQ